MKNLLTLLLIVFGISAANAGTKILEGKYQNKNVYVINSLASSGVGYCVFEVRVNGEVTTDETNSSAFEIDLSIYNFQIGDNITVAIKFKDDCEPRVLNPGALEPQPTFEVTKINVNDAGVLSWDTKNEQGEVPFIVQQFKWNKWVDVGELMGQGSVKMNSYTFGTNLTSGKNKFRIVQKSQGGKLRKSPIAEIENNDTAVGFQYNKKSKTISFSKDTGFELYNEYGQIIKRGYGTVIETGDLSKGRYYLNFDASTEVIDL